jgi:hypothetical protein
MARTNKNECAVGDTSRRWKKPSFRPAQLVSASNVRDDKWPAWVRFLILVGASLVLWGAIVLVWVLVIR